jgi:hypothetical protein
MSLYANLFLTLFCILGPFALLIVHQWRNGSPGSAKHHAYCLRVLEAQRHR